MDKKMKNNEMMKRYLETAPIGQAGDVSKAKIEWMKCNFLKFFPGKKKVYLEIGPGQGETLMFWKELGYENIQSVDIAEDVCEHIQKMGFKCDLVDDTTNFLNNNKEKFDLIMLNDVVEHISKSELVEFMSAVFVSLKKGGAVIIKVPNAQSPHFAVGRYGDLTHVQSFTELSLTQLLNLANFKEFKFYAESIPLKRKLDIKQIIAIKIIMPIYFWWIKKLRNAIAHNSPEILTQAIIAVAKKI